MAIEYSVSESVPDSITIEENRPAIKSDVTTIGKDLKNEGSLDASVYYHESGELFAEDIDQHMADLPEIVTTTAKVSIDDIQVGDPGGPLTDDQEKLRLLIWKNRHLSIGVCSIPYHLLRVGPCAILMWEVQVRSRSGYNQSHLNSVRN